MVNLAIKTPSWLPGSLRIEGAVGESLLVAVSTLDDAEVVVELEKGVNGRLVGRDAVLEQVAPGCFLLFESFAEVGDGEAAPVVHGVLACDRLRLFEPLVKLHRQVGMLLVELFAQGDAMDRGVDARLLPELAVLLDVVGP